jgi:hypothetical protein
VTVQLKRRQAAELAPLGRLGFVRDLCFAALPVELTTASMPTLAGTGDVQNGMVE